LADEFKKLGKRVNLISADMGKRLENAQFAKLAERASADAQDFTGFFGVEYHF